MFLFVLSIFRNIFQFFWEKLNKNLVFRKFLDLVNFLLRSDKILGVFSSPA